jgi:YVTN family beta-propeller protein
MVRPTSLASTLHSKTEKMLSKKLILSVIALAAIAASTSSPALAAGGRQYAVQRHFDLEGQGRWDYTAIDEQRQRLYLSRGDHVQILQLPSGKPIAEIPNTPGVHGFAFAQDLKLGFISVGGSDKITVFDLETMRPRQEIKVGGNPDAILYEPLSHKLFAFNGKSHDISVIDARTLAVDATIPAGGRPEFAVSDDTGKVYFNIEDNAGIGVIDVASNSIAARWKLNGCDEPSGLAIDTKRQRLFSTCQNRILAVTDARTGALLTTVPIGEHPDAAVFDAATGTIFSSNGGGTGTLTVIHEDDANHYRVQSNVATQKRAKTMAFDSGSKVLYLPTIIGSNFSVLVVAPQ